MITTKNVLFVAMFWATMGSFGPLSLAQDTTPRTAGPFQSMGDWTLRIELTEGERAALESATPQFPGFGGSPSTPAPVAGESKRDSVPNLFGTRFPVVQGELQFAAGDEHGIAKCQLRYDGDFTYMMSATGPKRPMYLSLLHGQSIQGCKSFRFHTMQFDPTMLRERVTAHVFGRLKVPATGTSQYIGNEWAAYAPAFRATRIPSKVELELIIKAIELIESILKPSEKIAQGYETQKILLESGTTLTGFVIGESGRQISLRDSQGTTHTIERDEIEDRSRQKSSAMPESLAASLEPKQMADLIAYLQSL